MRVYTVAFNKCGTVARQRHIYGKECFERTKITIFSNGSLCKLGMTHSNINIHTRYIWTQNVIGYVHLCVHKMFDKSLTLTLRVSFEISFYYVVSFYDRPYHFVLCICLSTYCICHWRLWIVFFFILSCRYLLSVSFWSLNMKKTTKKFRASQPSNFVICQFQSESTWWHQ